MKFALTVVTVGLIASGCSAFRRDADNAPPPLTPRNGPTTVPSNESSGETFGGVVREVFVDLPLRAIDYFSGDTPTASVLKMEDQNSADRRRVGIDELVDRDFGRSDIYTKRYSQIARFDSDVGVRAAAIRALNLSREGAAKSIFVNGLGDPEGQIRLESAKALANVPDPAAVEPLSKLATDPAEGVDIRIAAVDALRHYRQTKVMELLIKALNDRDFAIAWQARRSLRALTGTDYRYDTVAWNKYVDEHPVG